MARPHKQTVDYFPHDTDASEGKTLTIIQAKYGNDGYAFWFKLLQILGKSPGHYYNFNNPADWEFLLAKTHINDTDTAKGILDTLSLLSAIDPELYACGYIWSDNFVKGVADAYNRSIEGAPERPAFLVNVSNQVVNVSNNGDNVDNNPEIITEIQQTKGILKDTKLHICSKVFDIFWKAYPRRISKGKAEKVFVKLNPDEKLLHTILTAIEQAKKSQDWLEDNGKYIPYPATWLNAKGWEDEHIDREKSNGAHQGNTGAQKVYTELPTPGLSSTDD